MCFIAAAIPLAVAVAFSTDVALSLDPVYAMLPNPEPYFRDIVGSAVTRLRLGLALLAIGLVVLAVAAGRSARLGRVFSSIWTQVGLALLILVLPVGIAVLAVRTLILGSDEQTAQDPIAGERWLANATFPYGYVPVTTNAMGLRGPPVELAKPAGTKRVVFLGGAMTVSRGLYLEDTFPMVAQATLRERTGQPVEVINASVSNWRVPQTVAYMTQEGYRLSPDVVVICVTIYDIISPRPQKPSTGPKPKYNGARMRSSNPISTWMMQREKFGAYARLRALQAEEIQFKVAAQPPKAPHALSWSHPVTHPEHPAVETAWSDTLRELDKLIADARARNYQVVIVAYPFASQIAGDERARAPQARFAKFGAERGVPVLDLIPPIEAALKATGKPPSSFFVDGDHHPTRAAARIIGNEIARFLLENGASWATPAAQRSHQ